MIDYEVNIFNEFYEAVHTKCAKGKVSNIYVPSPTAFPASSLYELSNTTVRERQSSTPIENFSRVMYQLDCYAMSKPACRDLFKTADEKMISMGFSRINGDYLDNFDNTNVFRYTARYEAVIDREGNIYRNG
jgi:hypothetical protein